jgi:2,4-dienoyl-CoA reductase-like NADH-dependent reductase (Old Yellow Enzyme family)
MTLKYVSQPLRLGSMEIRNRIVRTAHGARLGPSDGVSEDQIAYHVERAKGGCAMSILEVAAVHPTSIVEYGVYDDKIIPGFRKLSSAVHAHGMKLLQQLWYGGNLYRGVNGAQPYSVSSLPGYMGVVGRVATRDDIQELVEAFAKAAVRCQEGGLDGVEVHAAHGYAFTQFLSKAYNNRTDEYGGSLENRARFLLETLRAIRKAVGPDFVLGIRVSGSQAPNFLDSGDVAEVVKMVEAEALTNYLNVAFGDYYRMDTFNAGMHAPSGYELPGSEPILAASKLPRIVAGRFRTLDEAETVIREGVAEMVSMVRAHIADPYIVNKSLRGEPEQVRSCIACNQGCGYNRIRFGRIGCTVNPSAGFELTMGTDIPTTDTPLKVLVVGGGVAGLEAARTAATAGHKVVLAEAAPKLGGKVLASMRAPILGIFGDLLQYLEGEVYRQGVEVRLGTYMNADEVRAENADRVIIATGAEPRSDGFQIASPGELIPGAALPHVISSVDLLMGGHGDLGESALILDSIGSYHAVAVAEHLLNKGLAVTYVTHLLSFAPEGDRRAGKALERFVEKDLDFTVLLRHQIAEIRRGQCVVRPIYSQRNVEVAADTVVLVTQDDPRRDLFDELGGEANPTLTLIGDALSPRDMQFGIADGHRAARALDCDPATLPGLPGGFRAVMPVLRARTASPADTRKTEAAIG